MTMTINVTYDQATNSLPAGFTTVIQAAVNYITSHFNDPITFNLHVGFGTYHNGDSPGSYSKSFTFATNYTLAGVEQALINHATSADDKAAVATLPKASEIPSPFQIFVPQVEAAVLGLLSPPGTIPDTYIGFNNTVAWDYNSNDSAVAAGKFDLFDAAIHEISEVMGRFLLVGNNNAYYPFDFFHYQAPATHDWSGATKGFFSIDNGQHNLNDFNSSNLNADFGDWGTDVGADAFNAVSNAGLNPVSETDLRLLDILGYTRGTGTPTPPPPTPPPTSAFSASTAATEVYQAMFNAPPSSTELSSLIPFTNNQYAFGQQVGVLDATVCAYEALGETFASSSYFANKYGPPTTPFPGPFQIPLVVI